MKNQVKILVNVGMYMLNPEIQKFVENLGLGMDKLIQNLKKKKNLYFSN